MNDQGIKPSVAIIMGSQSDWETMKFSEKIFTAWVTFNFSFL